MTNPTLVTTPFANIGTKNDIPEVSASEPQLATMQAGFPAITQQPLPAGIPPERADFNGILNLYGQHVVHLNKGLAYEFDQEFANKIGGYPLHAELLLLNGDKVQSTTPNNTTNPNVDMAGWGFAAATKDSELMAWSGRTQEEKNKNIISVSDFSSLQEALYYSAANNSILVVNSGVVHTVGAITIPNGSKIQGVLNIRWDGSSLINNYIVSVGTCTIEGLIVSTDGTHPTNAYLTTTAPNVNIGYYAISQDVISSNGVNATMIVHDNCSIGTMLSYNIKRPIVVYGSVIEETPTHGFTLGSLYATNVVRGFGSNTTVGMRIGNITTKGRHPEASISVGHNGVLLENTQDASLGIMSLADIGEHAFRISNGMSFQSKDITVEDVRAYRVGGCAFKSNSVKGYPVEGVVIGSVYGEDVGNGTATPNQEIVRITHARHFEIDRISSKAVNFEKSGARGFIVNDVSDIKVGSITLHNIGTVPIGLTDDQDGLAGSISNVYIGSVFCRGTASSLFNYNTSEEVSNFYIGQSYMDNVSKGVFYFNKTPNLAGNFTVADLITSSGVGTIFGPYGNNNFKFSYTSPTRSIDNLTVGGDVGTASSKTFKVQQFSISTSSNDLSLLAPTQESASGTLGSGFSFARPTGGRRGAGIAVKQYGKNVNDTGVAFYVDSLSVASDSVVEKFVVKRNTAQLNSVPIHTDVTDALSAGLVVGDIFRTATGQLMIVY